MFKQFEGRVHKETKDGTYLYVLLPEESLTDEIKKFSENGILKGELRIDDGRTISSKQRKKAWATLTDIALWSGNYDKKKPAWLDGDKENDHWYLKHMYMIYSGEEYFSLSDCSMTTARYYISFLLDFCLGWNVPLSEPILHRTDDIDAAIYATLKNKKCIVCGAEGEIHHWDPIGMGRDRNTYDDSEYRKLCLCRIHHDEAHSIGGKTFEEKHHVYGIIYND